MNVDNQKKQKNNEETENENKNKKPLAALFTINIIFLSVLYVNFL